MYACMFVLAGGPVGQQEIAGMAWHRVAWRKLSYSMDQEVLEFKVLTCQSPFLLSRLFVVTWV